MGRQVDAHGEELCRQPRALQQEHAPLMPPASSEALPQAAPTSAFSFQELHLKIQPEMGPSVASDNGPAPLAVQHEILHDTSTCEAPGDCNSSMGAIRSPKGYSAKLANASDTYASWEPDMRELQRQVGQRWLACIQLMHYSVCRVTISSTPLLAMTHGACVQGRMGAKPQES